MATEGILILIFGGFFYLLNHLSKIFINKFIKNEKTKNILKKTFFVIYLILFLFIIAIFQIINNTRPSMSIQEKVQSEIITLNKQLPVDINGTIFYQVSMEGKNIFYYYRLNEVLNGATQDIELLKESVKADTEKFKSDKEFKELFNLGFIVN